MLRHLAFLECMLIVCYSLVMKPMNMNMNMNIFKDILIFTKVRNRKISAFPLKAVSGSHIFCALECLVDSSCGAFHINPNNVECELFTSMCGVKTTIDATGWTFYYPSIGKYVRPIKVVRDISVGLSVGWIICYLN